MEAVTVAKLGWRLTVRTKIKQCSLIVCLFLFLFVVIGGGLHLKPGGAFVAAATGTRLLIYMFNRRLARERIESDLWPPRKLIQLHAMPHLSSVHVRSRTSLAIDQQMCAPIGGDGVPACAST